MRQPSFHDVGSIFPGETKICSVESQTTVREAISIMLENKYSQLPVIDGDEILGIFSLRTLAHQLMHCNSTSVKDFLTETPVSEVVDHQFPKITVKESLDNIIEQLENHEAILVNSPHGPQAIATSSDVLRYFVRVAKPFVLIQEIELALRNMVDICAPKNQLNECINRSIAKKYESQNRNPPETLSDMTFEEIRMIIVCSANWSLFEAHLGKNKDLVGTKLEIIRKIRNNVFHFKNDITWHDLENLISVRNWLLGKLRRLQPIKPP
jgi:hypothetical protein